MNHQTNCHDQTVCKRITKNIPMVKANLTFGELHRWLNKHIDDFETIHYIYAVDDQQRLLGILPIKHIFRHDAKKQIKDFYTKRNLVTVSSTTDQEKAGYLALKKNLKQIPVLDERKALIGILTSDAILAILHQEMREDILQLSGIQRKNSEYDDILTIPLWLAIKHRLPWLLVGLLGGMLAAGIVGSFEKTLESNLVLAAFIPLIVYMADAVGTQIEAFVIRDFAVAHRLNYSRYFLKQGLIVFSLAVAIGLSFGVISIGLYGDAKMAVVVSIALFFAVMSSVLSGLLIPYLFTILKQDPANASGPIATIIQDVLSVLIYFTVANILL